MIEAAGDRGRLSLQHPSRLGRHRRQLSRIAAGYIMMVVRNLWRNRFPKQYQIVFPFRGRLSTCLLLHVNIRNLEGASRFAFLLHWSSGDRLGRCVGCRVGAEFLCSISMERGPSDPRSARTACKQFADIIGLCDLDAIPCRDHLCL